MNCNMLIRKCLPSLLLVTCAKLHQMPFSSDLNLSCHYSLHPLISIGSCLTKEPRPSECLFSYKVNIHGKADSLEAQATLLCLLGSVSQKQLNPFFNNRKKMIWRQKTFHVSRFTGDDLPKIRKDANSNSFKYKESANKQCG